MFCQHGWCLNGFHVYRFARRVAFFYLFSLRPGGRDNYLCWRWLLLSGVCKLQHPCRRPWDLPPFLNSGPHGGAEGLGLWIFFFA